jgi:hypothetical protein
VRIRRLLFFLVPILLGDTTPHRAALGPAPRCLPPALQATAEPADVLLPISYLDPAIPNYGPRGATC